MRRRGGCRKMCVCLYVYEYVCCVWLSMVEWWEKGHAQKSCKSRVNCQKYFQYLGRIVHSGRHGCMLLCIV